MGKNGAGKSTLLKMIAGALEPDSGTVKLGASLKLGYFAQQALDILDPELSIWEQMVKDFPQDTVAALRGVLGAHGSQRRGVLGAHSSQRRGVLGTEPAHAGLPPRALGMKRQALEAHRVPVVKHPLALGAQRFWKDQLIERMVAREQRKGAMS